MFFILWFIGLCKFTVLSDSTLTPLMRCECMHDSNCPTKHSTCWGQKCYSSWSATTTTGPGYSLNTHIMQSKGCLNFSQSNIVSVVLFCTTGSRTPYFQINKCCDDKDMCNIRHNISKSEMAQIKEQSYGAKERMVLDVLHYRRILIAFLCFGLCLLFLFITCLLIHKRLKCNRKYKIHCWITSIKHKLRNLSKTSRKHQHCHHHNILPDHLKNVDFSGSGSGLPLLAQRTIARQIRLIEVIGKGRFGEVWLGQWHDEMVAVKIFSARDERSWFRETEIYQTALNRHVNILGFIASDNKDTGSWTQLWLVTEYHKNGSLYDYLLSTSVSIHTAMNMIYSIATGLNHLHMSIEGYDWKPSIAHRDIKSKNILVKTDCTCCISDFGLAVKLDTKTNKMDIMTNSKGGTNRYMSPEGLNQTLKTNSFDAFRYSDMYSFGLVMWEICNRIEDQCICELKGKTTYQQPYYEYVNVDPTIEEMKQAVCVEKKRPSVKSEWSKNKHLLETIRIMNECWYEDPFARLSALRVKKSMLKILQMIVNHSDVENNVCGTLDFVN